MLAPANSNEGALEPLWPATRLNAMSNAAPRTHDYRPEVDGLRALAVLPVLLYHLSGGGLLVGGFLGVDVFFVISGYLITRILVRDFTRVAGLLGQTHSTNLSAGRRCGACHHDCVLDFAGS